LRNQASVIMSASDRSNRSVESLKQSDNSRIVEFLSKKNKQLKNELNEYSATPNKNQSNLMLQPKVKSSWHKLKSSAVSCVIKVTSREARVMSNEPKIIFVGRKPPMNYVLGIITSFAGPNVKEVTLKARGQAINTAVDAAEIARHKFMTNLSISKISIGTEEMSPREGESRNRNISTIEITLTRQ